MENSPVNTASQQPDKSVELIAWHWYDLTCPFCYVSKSRSAILESNGFNVISLPFQVHPEVPAEGVYIGKRSGAMYEVLEKEARETNLPLNWSPRLPNSRYALAMAEQVRRNMPTLFPAVKDRLYAAHFALNEDLGSTEVVNNCLREFGIDAREIKGWLESGLAYEDLQLSEKSAGRAGLGGTPAWFLNGQLISGLQSRAYFQQFTSQP